MQQHGSATSSPPATSPPASSMNAASKTCTRPPCEASSSAISSPALGSGPSPFAAPGGPTTDLFGPALARANLSARQAKALGLLTSGTSGPLSTGSSPSAVLQSYLESRLRAVTLTRGSTLYRLTWSRWVTPSGVSRSRLRASARRKSESVRTGWPTPRASDWDKNIRTLDGALREIKRKGSPQDLPQAALVSGGLASMAANVRLNPDLSRWLMHIPACWSACAPTATPSTPSKPASSSKP